MLSACLSMGLPPPVSAHRADRPTACHAATRFDRASFVSVAQFLCGVNRDVRIVTSEQRHEREFTRYARSRSTAIVLVMNTTDRARHDHDRSSRSPRRSRAAETNRAVTPRLARRRRRRASVVRTADTNHGRIERGSCPRCAPHSWSALRADGPTPGHASPQPARPLFLRASAVTMTV